MKKIFNEFKSLEKGDDVVIEGWANKAVVDEVGDLMNFEDVDMSRFKKNPIIFFNHDRSLPIGKATETKITPEGLWIKAKISKSDNPIVSYVRDLVKEGILKTFSIGFDPKEQQINRSEGYNEITKWKLNEVSVVTLPCNVDAEFQLSKAKSLDEARDMVKQFIEENKKAEQGPVNKPEENVENSEDLEGFKENQPSEDQIKNAFQECVQNKIPKLIEEGRDQEDAVAIAMSMCRDENKCDISLMSSEAFTLARKIASDFIASKQENDDKKPEENPEEKKEVEVSTPVSQPSDDPSNFGSPYIDLLKSQLALLGKISEQIGSTNALLENMIKVENNNESEVIPTTPVQVEDNKDLTCVSEIKGRIENILKELGH